MAEEIIGKVGNLVIGTLITEENWDGIGKGGCYASIGG